MDIIKASGGKEPFDREKLCRSLRRAGARKDVVDKVCGLVEREIRPGVSTEQVSIKASRYLKEENLLLAAKYNLRRAIMDLGPAGFLFEEYVAAILREYEYEAQVGQILRGKCVRHEIDIVAAKDGKHYFIEVKYHNSRGLKSDVQVAMYMYARYLDLKPAREKREQSRHTHEAWLITNTKFTSRAIRYASCMGIHMTGWRYPKQGGIEDLIVKKALYPVTVLPSANRYVREQFAAGRLLFVKDLLAHSPQDLVKKFQLHAKTAKKLVQEAYDLV